MTYLLLTALLAADWPVVRGPLHDGSTPESGLLSEWPAKGPNVLWTADLGKGYSAVVVSDGRAVTHYQTATGQYLD